MAVRGLEIVISGDYSKLVEGSKEAVAILETLKNVTVQTTSVVDGNFSKLTKTFKLSSVNAAELTRVIDKLKGLNLSETNLIIKENFEKASKDAVKLADNLEKIRDREAKKGLANLDKFYKERLDKFDRFAKTQLDKVKQTEGSTVNIVRNAANKIKEIRTQLLNEEINLRSARTSTQNISGRAIRDSSTQAAQDAEISRRLQEQKVLLQNRAQQAKQLKAEADRLLQTLSDIAAKRQQAPLDNFDKITNERIARLKSTTTLSKQIEKQLADEILVIRKNLEERTITEAKASLAARLAIYKASKLQQSELDRQAADINRQELNRQVKDEENLAQLRAKQNKAIHDALVAHLNDLVTQREKERAIENERFINERKHLDQLAALRLAYERQQTKGAIDQSTRAMQNRIAREVAIFKHGKDSIEYLNLRTNQRIENLERIRVKKLLEIEEQYKAGVLNSAQAIKQARDINSRAGDALARLQKSIRDVNDEGRRGDGTFKNLGLRILEFVGLYRIANSVISTITNSIRAIPQVGIHLDAVKASLSSTIGSIAGGANVLIGINEEAQRTGISIAALRESFKTFQASTSLAGESLSTTWKMFTNINTVATALHLSVDQTNHVFLALAQIFNKSKVQSEELVKQLGNLLPGAFASFQKANEKAFSSTQELVKALQLGLVSAHETVANFTEYMANRFAASFEIAANGLNANFGRMQTAFVHLGETIYEQTSGAMSAFIVSVTSLVEGLDNLIKNTDVIGTSLTFFKELLTGLALGGLVKVLTSATAITTVLDKGKSILLALTGPVGRVTALVVALAEAYDFAKEKAESYFGIINSNDQQKFEEHLAKFYGEQNKPKEVTLEMKIEEDPSVQQARKDLDDFVAKYGKFNEDFTSLQIPESLMSELRRREAFLRDARNNAKETLKASEFLTRQSENLDQTNQVIQLHLQGEIYALEAQGKHNEAQHKRFLQDSAAQIKTLQLDIERQQENLRQAEREGDQASIDRYKANIEKNKITIQAYNDYAESKLKRGLATQTLETSKEDKETAIALSKIKQNEEQKLHDLKLRQLEEENNLALRGLTLTTERKIFYENQVATITRNTANEELALRKKVLDSRKVEGQITEENTRKALAAVMQIESGGGKAGQVSYVGAMGKMQIMPSTARGLGLNVPPEILKGEQYLRAYKGGKGVGDKESATYYKELIREYVRANEDVLVEFGKKEYLRLLDIYKDYAKAAAAYNAGQGRVKKDINIDSQRLPNETRDYVNKFTKLVESKDTLAAEAAFEKDVLANNKEISKETERQVALKGELNKALYESNILTAQTKNELLQAFNLTKTVGEQEAIRLEYEQKIAQAQANNNFALTQYLTALRDIKITEVEINTIIEDANKEKEKNDLRLQQLANQAIIGGRNYFDIQRQVNELRAKSLDDLEEVNNKLREQLKLKKGLVDESKLQKLIDENEREIQQKKSDRQAVISQIPERLAQNTNVRAARFAEEQQFRQLDSSLDSEITRLEKRKALKEDFNQFELTKLQELYTLKEQLAQDHADKMFNIELENGKLVANQFTQDLLFVTGTMQQIYGEQSKQAKAMFALHKSAAVISTTISTYQAAQDAYKNAQMIPYVGSVLAPVAAATAVAAGLARVYAIMSQPMPTGGVAHGGLTNVPKESTFLLDKGERVVSPGQNKDLTDFLNRQPNNKESNKETKVVTTPAPEVKIINVDSEDRIIEHLSGSRAEKVIMNVVRRNQVA